MKDRPYFKSFRSVMIGLAGVSAVIGIGNAADIGAPVLENWSARNVATLPQAPRGAEEVPAVLSQKDLAARGVQGPIRTEPSDRMARANEEMVRHDLQMKGYPMASGVGIP